MVCRNQSLPRRMRPRPRWRVKRGLVYFWALNDVCDPSQMRRYVRAFADANVAAVCLHPRPGLLLPYGGDAWFRFIRQTVEQCASSGVDVWLYDEDPYPSGACGGWITAERPDYQAWNIECTEADPAVCEDGLFGFPVGKLLWCGIVHRDGQVSDLTGEVGIVRRQWILRDPWDSRWYYPATPRYECPRSDTLAPEFAIRLPSLADGDRLVAYVARPGDQESSWGMLPDLLNPAVTAQFIERTHERYAEQLGPMFGREITAMFTDEPKPHTAFPWTPDLFESFADVYGYDLKLRLWHLFDRDVSNADAALTRLHYRQWVASRFESAWVEPVSRWCHDHDLALVGHISPEDDVLQQAVTVGNLMPLHRHFTVPGLDLIIPAVGDRQHPLISVGVVAAASAAQQQGQMGVLSESLGCSGSDFTAEQAGRILRWQAVMGVNIPVVHAAFNSTQGLRKHEAPPDFGPDSPRWKGMEQLSREMADLQAITREARQIAPVAVLWPIHGFACAAFEAYSHESPMRDAFVHLLQQCLDGQVGVHLLDEADLERATLVDGHFTLGLARYRHVVLPESPVWRDVTVQSLEAGEQQGVRIWRVGKPTWRQTLDGLEPADLPWPQQTPSEVVAGLPRLLSLKEPCEDVRCTIWEKAGKRTALLMNLGSSPRTLSIRGEALVLPPGEVVTQRLSADDARSYGTDV